MSAAPTPASAPDAAASTERRDDGAGVGEASLGYDPGWNASTWVGGEPDPAPDATLFQRALSVARLLAFALATLALLPLFFAARAMGGRADRRVAGWWCACGAWCCGLSVRRRGAPLGGGGALLVNHASWLDIMAIGSTAPVHFVAKAEVERWPIFGWIGRISNTVFIARRRAEAKAQEALLARRAGGGDLLCLFAEGTSSDGLRVLPFKSSLFSMFFQETGEGDGVASVGIAAQPVTIHYAPTPGLPRSFFGWWGRMPLFPHILNVTRLGAGGVATVIYHPPIDLSRFGDRKALAAEAERVVRAGLDRMAAESQAPAG
ncbi:MAG: lysophospholipid acyltransferase family protein [Pseudomonadota bacterium]